MPSKLAARVRLLASGDTNKNDPNDARSVAVAALRSPDRRPVAADDHAAVLKVWSKRHREVGRTRTQVACRLHVVLCELVPGGVSKRITAGHAAQVLASIAPQNAVQSARCELAAAFTEDLARIDAQMREIKKKLAAVVAAAGTTVTEVFGAGPVIAATVIAAARDVSRFPGRDHFAAYNGTAPIEVSSGKRKIYRLSRRGNRRLNHAIHMAAVSQVSHRRSACRAYFDKKTSRGKTPKEALRSLKRQVSDAIFTCLQADARHARDPGGQPGNHSASRAAGAHRTPALRRSHSRAWPPPYDRARCQASCRAFPGRCHTAAGEASGPGGRPQRSEDERPGGAARRRPYSATRKAACC